MVCKESDVRPSIDDDSADTLAVLAHHPHDRTSVCVADAVACSATSAGCCLEDRANQKELWVRRRSVLCLPNDSRNQLLNRQCLPDREVVLSGNTCLLYTSPS